MGRCIYVIVYVLLRRYLRQRCILTEAQMAAGPAGASCFHEASGRVIRFGRDTSQHRQMTV